MAKSIMIQGTASSVGKSILSAGLCRVFKQDGYNVAPFKSQNMALNSYATKEGLEMGRAQVVQAQACGLEPSVLMNPILLKPTGDKDAQVIVNGKVYSNLDACEYHNYKETAKPIVEKAYGELASLHELIVIEGAGSPAEINLRDRDIVNMGMAEIADAPVVLVGDIDRGGVFAAIVGTLALLSEEEKLRVKGVIINKFRGDIELLRSGLTMLEDIIKIPVLGVVPYFDLSLEDEDSVTERFTEKKGGNIRIAVVRLPHISNFTDFNSFDFFQDVDLRFVVRPEELYDADMVIIPGSKNTIGDLAVIKEKGFFPVIQELHTRGIPVMGICGGFQMLGEKIEDPLGLEGPPRSIDGLGLIPMTTVLQEEKITRQCSGTIAAHTDLLSELQGITVEGYEIRMGRSTLCEGEKFFLRTGEGTADYAGENLIGTYMHGIFDSEEFTRGLLNYIRNAKGLDALEKSRSYDEQIEEDFDRLAGILRSSLDMDKLYAILNGSHGISS